jgi:hypothetical protein
MNSPWQDNGSYIPFPKPIDAITDDPNASPDFGICLSAAWQAAVLGALKVLARPETYQGTDTDIAASVHNGYAILSAIQNPCGAAPVFPPFACAGDLSTTDQPYGTWSLGCVGIYISTQGYGPTLGYCPSSTYYGIFLNITFFTPLQINAIHLQFDMQCGHVQSGQGTNPSCVHVVDVTNGVDLAPPRTFDECISGFDIGYNAGPTPHPTSHIIVLMCTDVFDTDPPLPVGNCRLKAVQLSGVIPSGSSNPC